MSRPKPNTPNPAEILRALAEHLDVEHVLDDRPDWTQNDIRRALEAGAASVGEPNPGPPLAETVILFADGASRGNPGPSGAGAVFCDEDGNPLEEFFEYLGETTNNVAEYRALLLGLKKAEERGVRKILLRCDSQLLARQLQGRYKVKSPNLKDLYAEVRERIGRLDSFRVEHVYRDKNPLADALANRAIDEALNKGQ